MIMKKVLLIGDSPLCDSPYIRSYLEVLEQNNIPYDLLFWNRHLDNTELLPENYIPFSYYTDNNYPSWKRLYNIRKFARFANRWMCKKDYAFVVVFTIAHAIFMSRTLQKNFKNKYIFDIRDYSPLCNVVFFRGIVKRIIDNAAFTVISSAGFLRWLPKSGTRYVVAHNTTESMVNSYLDTGINRIMQPVETEVKVLTIGQISYYDSQVCFVNHLANREVVSLSFVGAGPASEPLKKYVQESGIRNVSFSGRYEKKDEVSIAEPFHMINIWLKHSLNADTCMANRFYLAAQLRKPMIVTKGSHQGVLCEKYGLGVVIDEHDDFVEKIIKWWQSFDAEIYENGCKAFLKSVKNDLKAFNQSILRLTYNTIKENF